MDKTLTTVEAPSTSGGSVLSLRARIQDLMQPTAVDEKTGAERQPINWLLDDDCDPHAPSLARVGVQFE